MSSIRVSYSGLISFLTLMISIFTGLIFTVIVTRQLEQVEFALWSLIGGIVVYSMILTPVSRYWVSRHIARGEEEAVTGIFGMIILSIGGIAVYLVAIFFISGTSDSDFEILLFAVFLIPFAYITSSFTAISGSYKPQGNAYAMLTFESTKIPVGFLLVYVFDMGVVGAISTSYLANSTMLIFYFLYLRTKLKQSFHGYTFKKWIRLSWIPVLHGMKDRLIHLDTTLFAVITGSVIGISYIGIARVMSNLVSNASSITVGLTPKLLATQKVQHIESMLDRTLLFAIPMLGFVIIFAKPGLWLLNPIYVDGVSVVILWSVIHFTWVVYGIFQSSLMGLEKVDVGFTATWKEYVKSRLFTVPIVYITGYSSYILALILVFWFSTLVGSETLETLFWWGLVGIAANWGILITFVIMFKKTVSIKFPFKKISMYAILTLISCIISHFLLSEYLQYKETVFDFILAALPFVILYIITYFALLFVLDKDARVFFSQIVGELKKNRSSGGN